MISLDMSRLEEPTLSIRRLEYQGMRCLLSNDRFKNELRDRHCQMMANKIDRSMPKILAWLETPEHKVSTYKEYHSVCHSSELGLPPTPHPQASVPPPPCFWGEGNTRWRERGWESPNSDEGHTLWYSLYVRTL